jgi:hypothetical protein
LKLEQGLEQELEQGLVQWLQLVQGREQVMELEQGLGLERPQLQLKS